MYVDILIIVNFFFNYYLLWLTSLLTRAGKSLYRISLGAFIGSLFSLTLFFPGLPLATLGKVLFSLLMIIAVFRPLTWLQFLKTSGVFYLVTFLSAGTVLALLYLFSTESMLIVGGVRTLYIPPLSFLPLVFSFAIILILSRFTWMGLWDLKRINSWKWHVTIRINGNEKTLSALVDTGNNLKEPVSGSPVIITSYQEFSFLVEICSFFENDIEGKGMFQMANNIAEFSNTELYIIPYTSLGNKDGLLLGFRPEEVEIFAGRRNRKWSKEQVIIGICSEKVSRNNSVQALIPPELIL